MKQVWYLLKEEEHKKKDTEENKDKKDKDEVYRGNITNEERFNDTEKGEGRL